MFGIAELNRESSLQYIKINLYYWVGLHKTQSLWLKSVRKNKAQVPMIDESIDWWKSSIDESIDWWKDL